MPLCTVTLVLPRSYPRHELAECIRPLAEPKGEHNAECYLGGENLVWHNRGYYFLFSCQPRQLVLNSVSDYNPLIGCNPQPLEQALNRVAMEAVEKVVIRRRQYYVSANMGNLLHKELRRNIGRFFHCSHWAVKNYFGPLPTSKIKEHYRELIAMAEQAIIRPQRLILISPDSEQDSKTLLLIDYNDSAYKCRLSQTKVRISLASPPGRFSVHSFRNQDIKITAHCIERFSTRVLGKDPEQVNPLLAEGELLKYIKNRTVQFSYLLGNTALINVSGYIFIGAVSRRRLKLVTVYRETPICVEEFHAQVLNLLQQSDTNPVVRFS